MLKTKDKMKTFMQKLNSINEVVNMNKKGPSSWIRSWHASTTNGSPWNPIGNHNVYQPNSKSIIVNHTPDRVFLKKERQDLTTIIKHN